MKLIDHWGTYLRGAASNYVTIALTFLVGALTPAAVPIFAFLGLVPSPAIQIGVGGSVIAILVGGPIVLTRLVAQPKLQAKVEAKQQEKNDDAG